MVVLLLDSLPLTFLNSLPLPPRSKFPLCGSLSDFNDHTVNLFKLITIRCGPFSTCHPCRDKIVASTPSPGLTSSLLITPPPPSSTTNITFGPLILKNCVKAAKKTSNHNKSSFPSSQGNAAPFLNCGILSQPVGRAVPPQCRNELDLLLSISFVHSPPQPMEALRLDCLLTISLQTVYFSKFNPPPPN